MFTNMLNACSRHVLDHAKRHVRVISGQTHTVFRRCPCDHILTRHVHTVFVGCSYHVRTIIPNKSMYIPYSCCIDMFVRCSRHVHEMFATCSWDVRDMFVKCSQHVHDKFITCSWHPYCIRHVQDMFRKCSRHAHNIVYAQIETSSARFRDIY